MPLILLLYVTRRALPLTRLFPLPITLTERVPDPWDHVYHLYVIINGYALQFAIISFSKLILHRYLFVEVMNRHESLFQNSVVILNRLYFDLLLCNLLYLLLFPISCLFRLLVLLLTPLIHVYYIQF